MQNGPARVARVGSRDGSVGWPARFARRVSPLLIATLLLTLATVQSVHAATVAVPPQPVSADPLPTVQVSGIVWAQVTVGNTVYATGRFTQARPAGVASGGVGTVKCVNLLAYNITTGVLDTSFVHDLTGGTAPSEGRAIAASPDGRRLYVGGHFSTVDGHPHSNLVAFDLVTKRVLSGFSGVNSTVKAVAATNTRVYLGGYFNRVGSAVRQHVAAFDAVGSLAAGWHPSITSTSNKWDVSAMVITPAQGNLIVGGSFNRVNNLQYLSNVALNLNTGAPVTRWASTSSTFPIRDQVKPNSPSGTGSAISSLSTDGAQVYLTSWGYGSAYLSGFFEGRAAISPVDGHVVWINDCHGDSYGAFPVGGVLYSVGHSHDCSMMGLWGQRVPFRAPAETTNGIAGRNVAPTETPLQQLRGLWPYDGADLVPGSQHRHCVGCESGRMVGDWQRELHIAGRRVHSRRRCRAAGSGALRHPIEGPERGRSCELRQAGQRRGRSGGFIEPPHGHRYVNDV